MRIYIYGWDVRIGEDDKNPRMWSFFSEWCRERWATGDLGDGELLSSVSKAKTLSKCVCCLLVDVTGSTLALPHCSLASQAADLDYLSVASFSAPGTFRLCSVQSLRLRPGKLFSPPTTSVTKRAGLTPQPRLR